MRARKLIIEVLIGLSVACAVLLPKLAPAQEPVVPGAFVAPAAAGQQQQWQGALHGGQAGIALCPHILHGGAAWGCGHGVFSAGHWGRHLGLG